MLTKLFLYNLERIYTRLLNLKEQECWGEVLEYGVKSIELKLTRQSKWVSGIQQASASGLNALRAGCRRRDAGNGRITSADQIVMVRRVVRVVMGQAGRVVVMMMMVQVLQSVE